MAKKTFRSSQKKRNSSSGPKLSGGSRPKKIRNAGKKVGGKLNAKAAGAKKSAKNAFGKGRKTAARRKK